MKKKKEKQTKHRKPHLREYIALSLIPQLGAFRIKKLMESVERPQEIFRLKRTQLETVPGIGPSTADMILRFNNWTEVDSIIEKTRETGAIIITQDDNEYPQLLKEIYDPPVLLWVLGNSEVLNADSVSVVGTRRPSSYGLEMADYFTRMLVTERLVIVSGLALGIDTRAHRSALENGGRTVAVLGSGIDVIYPSSNRNLVEEIVDTGGAVISEFPLKTKPDSGNFPVRNRIVSGMSLGTLVVESGAEGGSMITANLTLDQNREVFVVPHNLQNVNGDGCNRLIKAGKGKLVQNLEDILQELKMFISDSGKSIKEESPLYQKKIKWKNRELTKQQEKICRLLQSSERHLDDLCEQLNCPVHVLLPVLLELEMKECIVQTAGRIFKLKKL